MTLHSHVRPKPRQEESSANAVSAGPAQLPKSWDGGLTIRTPRSAELNSPMARSSGGGQTPKEDPGRWDTPDTLDPDVMACMEDGMDGEEGRVTLAVTDTPDTFLQRAVQRHQLILK